MAKETQNYESAEITVIRLVDEDVIRTSGENERGAKWYRTDVFDNMWED